MLHPPEHMLSSPQPSKIDALIILHSTNEETEVKETKVAAQGETAGIQRSQEVNPGRVTAMRVLEPPYNSVTGNAKDCVSFPESLL